MQYSWTIRRDLHAANVVLRSVGHVKLSLSDFLMMNEARKRMDSQANFDNPIVRPPGALSLSKRRMINDLMTPPYIEHVTLL